jgi:hypothetical protein
MGFPCSMVLLFVSLGSFRQKRTRFRLLRKIASDDSLEDVGAPTYRWLKSGNRVPNMTPLFPVSLVTWKTP